MIIRSLKGGRGVDYFREGKLSEVTDSSWVRLGVEQPATRKCQQNQGTLADDRSAFRLRGVARPRAAWRRSIPDACRKRLPAR